MVVGRDTAKKKVDHMYEQAGFEEMIKRWLYEAYASGCYDTEQEMYERADAIKLIIKGDDNGKT